MWGRGSDLAKNLPDESIATCTRSIAGSVTVHENGAHPC